MKKNFSDKRKSRNLLLLHIWLSCIHAASRISFLSARRRWKLERSASKRARRLIDGLGNTFFPQKSVVKTLKPAMMQGLAPIKPSMAEPVFVPAVTEMAEPCHPSPLDLLEYDLNPAEESYRILFVTTHPPSVGHAGGLRILDIMKLLLERVPGVYIEVFSSAAKELCGPLDVAARLADRVVVADNYNFSIDEYLRKRGGRAKVFDVVDFQFPQPVDVVEAYRRIGRKLIFTPMESLIRCDVIDGKADADDPSGLQSKNALLERAIVETVDRTVCVSGADRDVIAQFAKGDVVAIETGVSDIEFRQEHSIERIPFSVCYVAYFGSETNRQALAWYLKTVHPLVLKGVPDYRFSIIGRGRVDDLLKPDAQGIDYVGEVDHIAPHIARAAVGIAPALMGSGFRGKINQYAYVGVPCVASPLSADGLAYEHGKSIMVAKEPDAFAKAIITLLRDPKVRKDMADTAREVARANYSWDSKWPAIAEAYGVPEKTDILASPSVHAVVPAYQHAPYLEERIRSIFAQEYGKIRVTVIDDHSTDESDAVLRRLNEEFPFTYIRREANSGSPFTAWQYAAETTTEDLIWICESDDAADPMFLNRLVRLISRRDSVCLAYCASHIVDETSHVIGNTDAYFADTFHPSRWRRAFISDGRRELANYQRFGMVVPNMSSALIEREAFRKAFTDHVSRFRLAGDWLFIGRVMLEGDVAYLPERLNRFRKHPVTSRANTKVIRRLAEYLSVRITLSVLAGSDEVEILAAIRHDLTELFAAPDLQGPVMAELETLDPESASCLRKLLERHRPGGRNSTVLERVLQPC